MTTLKKYVKELVKDEEVEVEIRGLVTLFARFWLSGGIKSERMKVWNNATERLTLLDKKILLKIRSDRNRNGFAVDLGG